MSTLHRTESALHIGIIADDLTSAADGGAPFARVGHRVFVGFGGDALPPSLEGDVVALDMNSRAFATTAASSLAAEAGHRLRPAQVLLKTMDSTLRGHVGAEVAAVLLASGRRVALVAPAFPAAGRTTQGGVQRVDGVPVHRTSFAYDPRHPVGVSHMADLFRGTGLEPVVEVATADIRDPGRLHRALSAAQVVVADAGTDADLDTLVAAAGASDGVLWVGSPGIAQALARAYPTKRTALWASPPQARSPLVLVGSLHSASDAQIGALTAGVGASAVEIDPARVTSGAYGAEIERICTACAGVARKGGQVVVRSAPTTIRNAQEAIASALGEVARRLVTQGVADGLIATGGDTARAAARALGAEGLRLLSEPEPGVALGMLNGPHPVPIITKAGGFGDAGTLVRLCAALRSQALPPRKEGSPA